MREVDRIRHILRRLVGSVAEHHALVSCADRFDLFISHLVLAGFNRLVNAHRNVRRLLIQRDKNSTGIGVKSLGRIVIADLADCVARDLLIVHLCLGCDFTGNQYKAGACSCLAGNTAHRILCHAGIQNRV